MEVVKLVIEAAGIADSIAGFIAPPERSGHRSAVCADKGLAIDMVLVVGRAPVATSRTTRAIAVTISGARPVASIVSRLSSRFLDGISFKPGGTGHVAGFVVEAARVANRLSIQSSPPKRSGRRAAV